MKKTTLQQASQISKQKSNNNSTIYMAKFNHYNSKILNNQAHHQKRKLMKRKELVTTKYLTVEREAFKKKSHWST